MRLRIKNWAPRAIPQRDSGVALVMTLIMLSVITVVAVAFLALSQRERAAVTQSTQQNDAEIVADMGLERAKGEIVARLIAGNTNLNAVDLLVSLNYIRTNGFVTGQAAPVDPLNVNYEYRVGGAAGLNAQEAEQNIANLYYDPRVPVFINTNVPGGPQGPLEFRFYLDLDRNGRFETNGAYPLLDNNGQIIMVDNGKGQLVPAPHDFVGDPEWVGVLENPLAPHSRTNRFIGRYAFIVLPIGKSLDANFMHNHAKSTGANQDGFLRNMGVGPWEINLASFLADLNTNYWGLPNDYFYNVNLPIPSSGLAFQDALEIFNTRFVAYQNLAPAQQLFGAMAFNFNDGFVDHYSDGPLYITNGPAFMDDDIAKLNIRGPWPGSFANAGNTPRKNFFTPHDFFELFSPPALYTNFGNRLKATTFDTSSYDRYTFYRMLAQLSTDSASELPFANIPQLQTKISASNRVDFIAEPAGKINLNYNNLDYPITSMVPWGSDLVNGQLVPGNSNRFFNAVADVLLRSQFRFGVSNIIVTNYNVTVHRLLQMAANIHEVIHRSTNDYPAVFRPNVMTESGTGRLIISGYYQDDNAATVAAWVPKSAGLPMVIGAKKGFPNFNEYAADTVINAVRKLQLLRRSTNDYPYQTNEMFIIGIDNRFGAEAWNSYRLAYSNRLDVSIANNLSIAITNDTGFLFATNHRYSILNNYNTWPGTSVPRYPNMINTNSFKVPLFTNNVTLETGVYRPPNAIERVGTNDYLPDSGFHAPEWTLSVSNDFLFVMTSGQRLIDFVHIALTNTLGLTTNFFAPKPANAPPTLQNDEGPVSLCWSTNRRGPAPLTPTEGVLRQLDISLGQIGGVEPKHWSQFALNVGDPKTAVTNFYNFVFKIPDGNTNNEIQAPFTPARKMVITAKWEANDPLIHYMEEHLKDFTNNYTKKLVKPFLSEPTTNTLGDLNWRYQPWGGRSGNQAGNFATDTKLKDPGVRRSDDWEFTTNQFPGIGWLGRIHRGTPWQTIYLKSGMAPMKDWANFSLDTFSHPTNDWRLIDVFTAAVHPNASHGQLSINQTNFAAWSAVLGGVLNLSNLIVLDAAGDPGETFIPVPVEPSSQQLIKIYEGIQKVRESLPDQTFRRLGDLLRVPELSDGSLLINNDSTLVPFPLYGLSDPMLERIPQQILSLLKVGDPRYVIYAWGQSLRPAENSILSSGPYMGMCTNYQVTGEFVTRTVFQIEGTAGQPRPTIKGFNILSSD